MLLEEIVELLKKYQHEYWYPQTIEEINRSIQNITSILKDVQTYLSNKLYEINTSDFIEDGSESDIQNDIKSVKKQIKNMKNLYSIVPTNEIYNGDNNIIFDKKVNVFLVFDEICPSCNYKVESHLVRYYRIIDNKVKNEDVMWHRCEVCGKLFVLDYEAEEFDFNDTNIILDRKYYDVIPPIDINSVIVLGSTLKCSFNHHTNDITAQIPVLNKSGEVNYIETRAAYCSECDRFTVLKDEFDKINDIVTCKIIDETSNYKPYDSTQNDGSENDGSILKYYGYNVQTQKNISEQQRHIILSSIIEAGIMSRRQVVDLLKINIKRKSTRPDCASAIQKWNDDIKFVNTYKTEELSKVVFNKIILKYAKSI